MNHWKLKSRERIVRAAHGLAAAIGRFPVTVALLVITAIRVNWPIGPAYQQTLRQLDDYDGLVALGVLPLLAGAAFALAGALFAESRRWGGAASIAAAGVAAATGFALIHWHGLLGVYFGSALPAIGGSILVAPYLRGGTGQQLWRYLMRLGRAAFAAAAVGIGTGIILSLALRGVAILLPSGVAETSYFRVWTVAGLIVAALTGLSFVPRAFAKASILDGERLDVGVVRGLLDTLIVPFLLLYAVLLHGYSLLIVFKRDIPDGQTGFFVLAFCIALLAGVALASHFVALAGQPTRILTRIWPCLLPVPIVILLIAGGLRIADAGVTPDRYLFLLFGVVLAIIVALQLHPSTRGDIRYLLIVPVAALFFASVGPQGALATSIRSQTERFKAMVKPPPYTTEEALAARTALYFLDRYDAMEAVLPPRIPATDNDGDTALRARVAEAYGLNQIIDQPALPN